MEKKTHSVKELEEVSSKILSILVSECKGPKEAAMVMGVVNTTLTAVWVMQSTDLDDGLVFER